MVEEEISARLRYFLSAMKLSVRRLAKMAGLPQTDIYPVINGSRSPQIRTMKRICDCLGISLSDFFSENNEHLFLISPEEMRFLMAWRKLDQAEQKRILPIYLSP